MVAESHRNLPARQDAQQFDFLDEPSAEDLARSHKELEAAGEKFDHLDVLDHARAKRAKPGPKPGSKNRKTKDFERFLDAHGIPDPALVLGRILATPAEVHVQRSKVMDPSKKQLTYAGAKALQVRCAEALLPYKYGKKPVPVDLNVHGDFSLSIRGENISQVDADKAAAGEFVLGGPVEDAEYTEVSEGAE